MKSRVRLALIGVVVAMGVFAADQVQKHFYCKYCGTKFGSIQSLTASACQRHPNGKGRHALYEGTEKSAYICKYCGKSSADLKSLTASMCQRHPKGPAKGRHEPAL